MFGTASGWVSGLICKNVSLTEDGKALPSHNSSASQEKETMPPAQNRHKHVHTGARQGQLQPRL